MNDDDITEALLRASGYLDGELDPAETALAESDPAVMAEVERLRRLQLELRQVDAPSTAAREAALTAALTEYDTLRRPSPVVVPFKRRTAYAGWLGAAAAVVAIGLVGVVIAQSAGGDDDDSGGFDQIAEEQSDSDSLAGRSAGEATAEAMEAPTVAAASDLADAPAATEAPAGTEAPAATMAPMLEASPAPAATEAPAAESGDTGTASATTTAVGGETPPAFDPAVPITDEVELLIVGTRVLEDDAAGRLLPISNNPCGTDLDPRDFALADGLYVVDGVATPVLIAVDRFAGATTAFARDECIPIASGTAP